MLRKWKQKFGIKATYKQLCQAFEDCEKHNLVELVKQLADGSLSSESWLDECCVLLLMVIMPQGVELQRHMVIVVCLSFCVYVFVPIYLQWLKTKC